MLDGDRADAAVLAIDQGTSATKAVLVDGSGAVRRRSSVAIRQTFPRPGFAEQDPEEIWASVQRAVGTVLEGVNPAGVGAIGLSTQRESTLIWERSSGAPLGPVLGWQDVRASGLCAQLRRDGHADKVRTSTGLPLDAMFSASKASILLDEIDPSRSRSRHGELCIGTVDSWLLWKLSDGSQHLVESGNASRTQLMDINARCWDEDLLELFGVPVEALPTIVPSVGPFVRSTNLRPLPQGVPVTGVLGDSHAALFAHAGWRPGQVKVTYGTGSSVMGIMPSDGPAVSGAARTIAWDLGRPTYAQEGNIRSSGATLVWLARLFGSSPAKVASEAATDSDGVFFVPAFTGLGAPWWDDEARATIIGLSESTTPAHLGRAARESIAFQIEVVVDAIATISEIGEILADGGPSGNPILMQLQADTSGRRVMTSVVSELSSLGAAHVAGLAAGLWSMLDLEAFSRQRKVYEPSHDSATRESRLSGWHTAVSAARGRGSQQRRMA